MQLQRSLFSFYKFFIRKTPLFFWIGLALLVFFIISWQVKQLNRQQPVYNFDKCLMQFFNATRGTKNSTEVKQKDEVNQQEQSDSTSQKKQEIPFYLQPKYYHILNGTSTIKIYLSDEIPFVEGQPSCKIVLNTQRIKVQKAEEKKKEQNLQNQQKQKALKLLQQTKDDKIKIDNVQISQIKADSQNQELNGKQTKIAFKRSDNIKNFDEITPQQQKYFLSQHPFIHITANSHIVYLDQNNQFLEKHGVQVHAILLSKQQFEQYPESILGISSRLWRFHGNELIQRNALTLKSLAESFSKVTQQIKSFYLKNVETINTVISLKKFIEDTNDAKSNTTSNKNGSNGLNQTSKNKNLQTEKTTDQQKKVLEEKKILADEKQPQQSNATKQKIKVSIVIQQSPQEDVIQQLPTHLIQVQQIYPLSQMKLYFHYPQILRVQQLGKLVNLMDQDNGILYKAIFALFSYIHLYLISLIVGLVVRYAFFWIMTLYLFMGGCLINKQWGWVSNYFNLIRNRDRSQNNASLYSSGKMLFFFTLALMGILTIFSLGSKYILSNLFIYTMTFSENYYSEMLLKNFFIIELFYYMFCRSRVSLKYFPLLSLQLSLLVIFLNGKFYCYNISWLANLHLLAHLLLMAVFAAVENHIGRSSFYNEFTPCEEKPRALYYIGYDISWQNSLPPIWTYFTTQFDLSFFNEKEKALINRDYQLLYGRLLGMNERQQLPEDEQHSREEESNELNQNLSQSNEMSLIR